MAKGDIRKRGARRRQVKSVVLIVTEGARTEPSYFNSLRNKKQIWRSMWLVAAPPEFENAIEWLFLSGIVTRIYQVEISMKSLENYRK